MFRRFNVSAPRGLLAVALLFTLAAGSTAIARAQSAPASAAPAGSNDTVSMDLLQAENLSKSGQDKQAVDLLNRYIQQHPNSARALVDRGDLYQDAGDQAKAIADYSAAIVANPD